MRSSGMRSYLENGTLIRVSGGIIYKISGEPIGEGGGSVIYPAFRMLPEPDGDGDRTGDQTGYRTGYRSSRIMYAVKECYPQSARFEFVRDSAGEIRPASEQGGFEQGVRPLVQTQESDDEQGVRPLVQDAYLARAKEMQEREEEVSGRIYVHAFRLTPVIESYRRVELSFDDGAEFHPVNNMISIMESLSEKGESLKHCLAERKHLKVREAFEVVRQVLLAVNEIHKSGFLHLDIQDGNVFIKGVLDKNDSMISLIDLGSAKPMLDDGLCAEISDKVLYSTQGFTAPEILSRNDGHLRLGRQADLYSIGALALLLLTGHRSTTAELTANTSGKYIPRFAVRKTGCPAHLIDRMQKIIARALKNDPAERYESCDAMLADVEELLLLLAPHTAPLSAVDYDAFICYKHGERDNAAAKALRDNLERYRNSFKWKLSGGKVSVDNSFGSERKIRRVFLDEGELSSCPDFGEHIETALKNSEWLIVLCSEHTRESCWVNDEIRTFLKYHDKSRILAVVTEGEPEDVYPEELLRNDLTSKSLFAADARAEDEKGVLKKLRGDALLQIAAPILNTTFDTLKGRDRLYRMRKTFVRTSVAFCALAGFLSYAALKAHQIARQEKTIVEEQSAKIKSQAQLLAAQAEEAYEQQDYSDAMTLALSSMELSNEDQDQQSELKSILISCQNLYAGPDEAALLPVPAGKFDVGEDILGFFLNRDGSELFVLTDRGFSVWNTEDHSMISCYGGSHKDELGNAFKNETENGSGVKTEDKTEVETENGSGDKINDKTEAEIEGGFKVSENLCYGWDHYLLEDQKTYLLCSENAIVCYEYETGQAAWTRKFNDEAGYLKKVILSADQKDLFCLSYSYGDVTGDVDSEADSDVSSVADGSASGDANSGVSNDANSDTSTGPVIVIDVLDPSTGEIVKSHVISGTSQNAPGYCWACSPDGRYIAGISSAASAEDFTQMQELLCVYDLEEETVTEQELGQIDPWGSGRTTGILFADNERVLVSRYDGIANVRSTLDEEHSLDVIGPKNFRLSSCDLGDGHIVWQYNTANEPDAEVISSGLDLRSLRIPQVCRTQIDGAGIILAGIGNSLLVLNEEDGSLINKLELDSCIISLRDGENELRLILENGDLDIIPKGSEITDIRRLGCFKGNIENACEQDNCCYIQTNADRDTIIRYERDRYDESYTETFIEGMTAEEYLGGFTEDDRILEQEHSRLEISEDKRSFEIISGEKKTVSVGEEIQVLSFTPDKHGILAGLGRQIQLYDTDGNLVSRAELPKEISDYPRNAALFFPENSACFYTDGTDGYLLDINENSLKVVTYIKDVIGFDHENNAFLLCSRLTNESGGCTVGQFQYHTLEEIMGFEQGV